MAWEKVTWTCGHSGTLKLKGDEKAIAKGVAVASKNKCMACWLVEQWETKNDKRAQQPDRYILAKAIAENKDRTIDGLPENVAPVTPRSRLEAKRDILLQQLESVEKQLSELED